MSDNNQLQLELDKLDKQYDVTTAQERELQERSGNFGHAGRPGQQGGSAPGGGSGATPSPEKGKGGVSYSTHGDLYKPDWDVADGTYVPTKNIKLWIRSKEAHPTNAYYGSARIGAYDYTEYTATPKDTILKWPGGNFIIRSGSNKREFVAYQDTFKKGPFEHSYGAEGRYIPVGAMTYKGREYGKYSNVGEVDPFDAIDHEHGIIKIGEVGSSTPPKDVQFTKKTPKDGLPYLCAVASNGDYYEMYPNEKCLLSALRGMGYDTPEDFKSKTGVSSDSLVGKWFLESDGEIKYPSSNTQWKSKEKSSSKSSGW